MITWKRVVHILSSILVSHKSFTNNQYKTKIGIRTASSPLFVQPRIGGNSASASSHLVVLAPLATETYGDGESRQLFEMLANEGKIDVLYGDAIESG